MWGGARPGSCRLLKDSASTASELCQLSDTALHAPGPSTDAVMLSTYAARGCPLEAQDRGTKWRVSHNNTLLLQSD